MSVSQTQIIYDSADISQGMSTSKHIKDGGFSPETTGINLRSEFGVINAPGPIVDKSTNLVKQIIASCEDPAYYGKDRMILDDAGNLYSFDGSSLTKQDNSTSDEFTIGTTDIIPFQGNFYITNRAGANGDVFQWNGTSTLDEAWWTTTKSQAALYSTTPFRPMFVFEDHLFIGDKEKLHRVDTALAISNGILTLQSNDTISAIGKDPGTGKMIIAVNTGANYSGAKNYPSKILFYDGFSNKALRSIPVSGLITAFQEVNGVIYIAYQNKIGVWNGSGITPLRTLSKTGGTYKHQITTIEDTLYVIDGAKILAFGPVRQGGSKIWYTVLTASNTPQSIFNLGSNKLGYSLNDGTGNGKFYTHDVTSRASVITGGVDVYFNQEKLADDVNIKSVILEYSSALPTTAESLHAVKLKYINPVNKKEETRTLRTISGTSGQSEVEISVGIKAKTFQLILNILPETLTNVVGITRAILNIDKSK